MSRSATAPAPGPGLTGEQHIALDLSAGLPNRCTEAIMIAHGFPLDLLAGLIHAGLSA
jgi:hypothetical protein